MRFSSNDHPDDHFTWPIEEVLELLGWDGEHRPRGGWVNIRCPFHDDRRIGNAAFNEALNIFKCQACDAKGNSVTLVMQQRTLSAMEAVAWLEKNVGGNATSTPRAVQHKLPWERNEYSKWTRY